MPSMNESLKPCPFCGVLPKQFKGQYGDIYVRCENDQCVLHNKNIWLNQWNNRPRPSSLEFSGGDRERIKEFIGALATRATQIPADQWTTFVEKITDEFLQCFPAKATLDEKEVKEVILHEYKQPCYKNTPSWLDRSAKAICQKFSPPLPSEEWIKIDKTLDAIVADSELCVSTIQALSEIKKGIKELRQVITFKLHSTQPLEDKRRGEKNEI